MNAASVRVGGANRSASRAGPRGRRSARWACSARCRSPAARPRGATQRLEETLARRRARRGRRQRRCAAAAARRGLGRRAVRARRSRFAGSSDVDAAGTQSWREAMSNLAGALAPSCAGAAAVLRADAVSVAHRSRRPAAARGDAADSHRRDGRRLRARHRAARAVRRASVGPRTPRSWSTRPGRAPSRSPPRSPIASRRCSPSPTGRIRSASCRRTRRSPRRSIYLPMFAGGGGGARRRRAAAVRARRQSARALRRRRLGSSTIATSSSCRRRSSWPALGVRHVLYVGADARRARRSERGARRALPEGRRRQDARARRLRARRRRAGGRAARRATTTTRATTTQPSPRRSGVDLAFAWARPAWMWPHYWYRGCWWDGGLFWGDYGWYPAAAWPAPDRRASRRRRRRPADGTSRAAAGRRTRSGRPRRAQPMFTPRARRADAHRRRPSARSRCTRHAPTGTSSACRAPSALSHTILHGGAVVGGSGARPRRQRRRRSGSIGRAGIGSFGGGWLLREQRSAARRRCRCAACPRSRSESAGRARTAPSPRCPSSTAAR